MNPLIVSIVGMTVIFIGIIGIVIIICLISLLFRRRSERAFPERSDSEAQVDLPTENEGSISGEERRELIAAISAAICAATGMSLRSMRIRSIKRISAEGAERYGLKTHESFGRGEKIAAISAAIAVAGGMSSNGFRIVSIRKK